MRERKTWLVVTFHTTAAAIGMVSGLAATGAHQAVKQLCTGPDCGKTQ